MSGIKYFGNTNAVYGIEPVMRTTFFILLLFIPLCLLSQNDTIVAQNGDMLVGRVKGIASGIVTMKTMYSNKDFQIDYEDVKRLPLDFYVKLGFQFNYDNQPPEIASGFDYLLNTGVGWKFN